MRPLATAQAAPQLRRWQRAQSKRASRRKRRDGDIWPLVLGLIAASRRLVSLEFGIDVGVIQARIRVPWAFMRYFGGVEENFRTGSMCGRFTQHYTWQEVQAFLNVFGDLGTPRNLQPRYNIAPTTFIDVVTTRVRHRQIVGREMVPMRWGLVPSWWKKSRKDVPATFSARAETIAEKPMFRGAFKYRRCIIPASGFYEWTGEKSNRQPHLFTAANGSPILAFAGLWEYWLDPANFDEVISATIIVGAASPWMKPYNDRMPVILGEKDFDGWLDGSLGLDMLTGPPFAALRAWPVSKQLNRTGAGDDDPTMIEPTTA